MILMNKLITLLFVLFIATTVLAADYNSQADLEQAQNTLKNINLQIQEIRDQGFTVTRFADEYSVLRELYLSAVALADSNRFVDLRLFYERADSLENTIQKSREAQDELVALKLSIDDASKTIDTTQAMEIYLEAEREFNDQRYEIAIQKIDDGYEKLVELQGVQAKANAAYEATRKNVFGFLEDNWQIILTIILIPIIFYLLFRKQVKLYRLTNKINGLEFEVNVLKDEIKKTQKEYFIDGKVSEEEYGIKVRMYSEKIRDLHGTLALFNEKKEALMSGKKQLNTKKL